MKAGRGAAKGRDGAQPNQRKGRKPAGRGAGSVLRNVPPTSVRKGLNTQKSDQARKDRARVRRSGTLRRIWVALRTLTVGALITGTLGGAGFLGWRAYASNGFLALRQVDVVGNKLLGKAEILEKAGLELGTKLPAVPVAQVESALMAMPGVGDAEVKRIFPSRIEIRVKEKEPVAMGYARGWYGLAADGARIGGLDWGQSDLPVVDGFASLDSASRSSLGGFLAGARRAYPALYANFSQLSVRAGSLEIILRDGRLKVLLSLPEAAEQMRAAAANTTNGGSIKSLNSLEFLQALIDQQGGSLEPGRTVDLRVEGYAYVR